MSDTLTLSDRYIETWQSISRHPFSGLPPEILHEIAEHSVEKGFSKEFSPTNKTLRLTHPVFLAAWQRQHQLNFVEELNRYALTQTTRTDAFYRPSRPYTAELFGHYQVKQPWHVRTIPFSLPMGPECFYDNLQQFFTQPDPNFFDHAHLAERRLLGRQFGLGREATRNMQQEKWRAQIQSFACLKDPVSLSLSVPARGADLNCLIDFAVTFASTLRNVEQFTLSFYGSLSHNDAFSVRHLHPLLLTLAALDIDFDRVDASHGHQLSSTWKFTMARFKRRIPSSLSEDQFRDLLPSIFRFINDGISTAEL